jgi:ribose transport system substrate-binding protein
MQELRLTRLRAFTAIALSASALTATLPAMADEPAKPHADTKGLIVGYSTASLRDTLLRTWAEETCKTITEAGGQCLTTDAQASAPKQISDVQDLIARGANVLVINPVDAKGIVPAVLNANRRNIPVLTVDSTSDGGKVLTAVHVDNQAAGYGAAKYCAEQHKGETNIEVAELQGQAGQANTRNRHEGWAKGLKEFPQLKSVFDEYTNWDTGTAYKATQDLLTAHPNVKCIWAHSDAIILGAAQALERAKKTDVITVGMGMYGGGPEAIAAGKLTASWYMEPVKTAKAAGQAVLDYWLKGTSVPDIPIAMTFVTKDNINEYLKKTAQ